jgi:hypothetical protein
MGFFARVLGFVGCCIAGIGAALPWMHIDYQDLNKTVWGLEGDGQYVIGLALVCLLVIVLYWNWKGSVVVLLLGLGITAIGLTYLSDPLYGVESLAVMLNESEIRSSISMGIGLYLTAIGGGTIVATPLLDLVT